MEIYRATPKDIETLIKLRLDFLTMNNNEVALPEYQTDLIISQFRKYLEQHLPLENFIALMAKIKGQIASTVFLAITERPANMSCISGVMGTLLNVMTYPEYRQRGIAKQLLLNIIEEAKARGVSSIELNATDEGKVLYQKVGFTTTPYTYMRIEV